MTNTPQDVLKAARKEARLRHVEKVNVRDFILGFSEGYARACEAGNVVRAPDKATAFGLGFHYGWESVARLLARGAPLEKLDPMKNTVADYGEAVEAQYGPGELPFCGDDPRPPNTPTAAAELLKWVAELVGESLEHFVEAKENFEGFYDIHSTSESEFTVAIGDQEFVVRVEKKVTA